MQIGDCIKQLVERMPITLPLPLKNSSRLFNIILSGSSLNSILKPLQIISARSTCSINSWKCVSK